MRLALGVMALGGFRVAVDRPGRQAWPTGLVGSVATCT